MDATAVTRQDLIRYYLRRMALEVHPDAKYVTLAEAIDVHPMTLTVWIRWGRIPKKSARQLQRRFGPELAPADLLVGAAT